MSVINWILRLNIVTYLNYYELGKGQNPCEENITSFINDFQITATSYARPFTPARARTGHSTQEPGWCADSADENPYLQFDLLLPTTITGLEFSGWKDVEDSYSLRNVSITFGNATEELQLNSGNHFQMNITLIAGTDSSVSDLSVQMFRITQPTSSRYVRVHPVASRGNKHCMKIHLVGCIENVWSNVTLECTESSIDLGVFHVDQCLTSLKTKQTHYPVNHTDDCKSLCVRNSSCIAAVYKNISEECEIYGRWHGDMPVAVTSDYGDIYARVCVRAGHNRCGGNDTSQTDITPLSSVQNRNMSGITFWSSYFVWHYPSPGWGWCATETRPKIQFDLLVPTMITRLEFSVWDKGGISYSLNASITFGNTTEELHINSSDRAQMNLSLIARTDSPENITTLQTFDMVHPISSRYVRVHPLASDGNVPCMQIQLIGCKEKETIESKTYDAKMTFPDIISSPRFMISSINTEIYIMWRILFERNSDDDRKMFPLLMFDEILLEARDNCKGKIGLGHEYHVTCNVGCKNITSSFNGMNPIYSKETFLQFMSKSCDSWPPSKSQFRLLVGFSDRELARTGIIYQTDVDIISKTFLGLRESFEKYHLLQQYSILRYHYLTLRFKLFDVGCQRGEYFAIKICQRTNNEAVFEYCNLNKPARELQFYYREECGNVYLEYTSAKELETQPRGFVIEYSKHRYPLRAILNEQSQQHGSSTDDHFTSCSQNTCYYFEMFTSPNRNIKQGYSYDCKVGSLASINSLQELQFIRYFLENVSASIATGYLDQYPEYKSAVIGSIFPASKNGKHLFMWSDGSPVTFTAWSSTVRRFPTHKMGLIFSMFRDIDETNLLQPLDLDNINSNTTAVLCKAETPPNDTEAVTFPSHIANSSQVRGQSGYVACENGEYVSVLARCDDIRDCSDGSDEKGCAIDGNCQDKFQCGDGSCVPFSLYCDFINDCPDGSDEDTCVYPVCTDGQWRCTNGRCISSIARCNSKRDCEDHSDELDCGGCIAKKATRLDTCNKTTSFSCGEGICIPLEWVCDGFVDCPFCLSDEEDCSPDIMVNCYEWWKIGKRKSGLYRLNGPANSGPSWCGAWAAFPPSHVKFCQPGIVIAECNFDRIASESKLETIFHNIDSVYYDDKIQPVYENMDVTGPADSLVSDYIMPAFFDSEMECFQTGVQTCPPNRKMIADHLNLAYHPEYWDCLCIKYTFVMDTWSESLTPCSSATEKLIEDGIISDLSSRFQFYMPWYYWVLEEVHYLEPPPGPQPNSSFHPGPITCVQDLTESDVNGVFPCVRGHSIDSSKRCLNDYDEFGKVTGCRDLSHLQSCENFTCPVDYVKCPQSYCVPTRFICDGDRDCLHGEDEMNCNTSACPGFYKCSKSQICLPDTQFCDGRSHCPDGDDERLCNFTCPAMCYCSGYETVCSGLLSFDKMSTELSPKTRILDVSGAYGITSLSHLTLPFLFRYNLSDCGVETIDVGSFLSMSNLMELDLSRNKVRELYENMFSGLDNLFGLFLNGNKFLSTLIPKAFHGLSNLRSLHLANTGLKKLRIASFSGMVLLEHLDLHHSRINTIEGNAFLGLESLKELDLSQNDIDNFDQEMFNGLHSLHLLKTSAYKFCCSKPNTVPKENCFPYEDEFSSCSDLMRDLGPRLIIWLVGIFALFGNCLSFVYRVIFDQKKLKLGYSIFVTNLTLSDALMGIYLTIIAIADVHYRGRYIWSDEAWRNSRLCDLAGVLSTLSSEASVFIICCITLDRLLVIKFPFGEKRIKPKAAVVVSIICWLTAMLIALLPVVYKAYFKGSFYSKRAVCLALPLTSDRPAGWEYSLAIFVFFNFLVFVLIAFGQWMIYRELKSSREGTQNVKRRSDLAVARNLLLVVTTDFLCWFPIGVMGMMAMTGHSISGDVYVWACVLVLPVNSALNPFLYTFSAIVNKKKFSPSADEQKKVIVVEFERWQKAFEGIGKTFSVLPTISLKTYTRQKDITPNEAFIIMWAVTDRLCLLHENRLVQGNVPFDTIVLHIDKDVVRGVSILTAPKPKEKADEEEVDIRQLGVLARRFLSVIK